MYFLRCRNVVDKVCFAWRWIGFKSCWNKKKGTKYKYNTVYKFNTTRSNTTFNDHPRTFTIDSALKCSRASDSFYEVFTNVHQLKSLMKYLVFFVLSRGRQTQECGESSKENISTLVFYFFYLLLCGRRLAPVTVWIKAGCEIEPIFSSC